MNVLITLPNDEEFEFDAELEFTAGYPDYICGLPENCYQGESDSAEFINYGPYTDMFDAVYVACWVCDCPMTIDNMSTLADRVETETIDEYIDRCNG